MGLNLITSISWNCNICSTCVNMHYHSLNIYVDVDSSCSVWKVLKKIIPKNQNNMFSKMSWDYISDVEVLYNSDLSFKDRLYGPLDVDVCRIKLHEPLDVIVQQPLLYVRDMVPKACFQALIKLNTVSICNMKHAHYMCIYCYRADI